MNATNFFSAALFFFASVAFAQSDPLLNGGSLVEAVIGKNGRTLTLENGDRDSFFLDGTFVTCTSKPGYEICDAGTYKFQENKVVRTFTNWLRNGSHDVDVKLTATKFNGLRLISVSDTPTLVFATQEQIMSLAGKSFKQNYKDEGLQVYNFNRSMTIFACNKRGCATTLPLQVSAPWVEWAYRDSFNNSGKTLVLSEGGYMLWGGRKLIPQ